MSAREPMESVINEIEFNFKQTVSIRTDVKLSKDDVKQIVSEAPAETLEEIVYQSLVTDELYLRARAKEIATKLKQDDLQQPICRCAQLTRQVIELQMQLKEANRMLAGKRKAPETLQDDNPFRLQF